MDQVLLNKDYLVSISDDHSVIVLKLTGFQMFGNLTRQCWSGRQSAVLDERNYLTFVENNTIHQYQLGPDSCQFLSKIIIAEEKIESILPVQTKFCYLYLIGTKGGLLMLINFQLKKILKQFQITPGFQISQIEKLLDWTILNIWDKKTKALRNSDYQNQNQVFRQIVPWGRFTSNLVVKGDNIFYYDGKEFKVIHTDEIKLFPERKELELHSDMEVN